MSSSAPIWSRRRSGALFDSIPIRASAETVLSVTTNSSEKLGLLFRKPVGQGQVYTIATLPDSRFTNLATHPIFLPMLVRLALQSFGTSVMH